MKIIDIHTHGIGGFDTSVPSEDHILEIAKIQGSHGTSDIIPTVYASSIETMRDNMGAIKKAMETQQQGIRNRGTEAKIIGIHLEGPFLNPSQCGVLDASSFLEATELNLRKIIDGFEDAIKIVTIAPEIEGAITLIKCMANSGIIPSMGHSDATYAEAEAGFHAGARGVTHLFNAMRGIHHREPGIAGFGLLNNDIYTEIIADPFHLDHKMIDLIFSIKNPERIIIISDTVKTSKSEGTSHGIKDRKGKLLGGSTTLRESSERLIHKGLEKDIILKAISENPERYLTAGEQ